MVSSKEELYLTKDTLIYLLQNLRFLINVKKSILQPCQFLQFLDIEINFVDMTLNLSKEKEIVEQSGSSYGVISFHKGTKPINSSTCINSNCSFVGTFIISTPNYKIVDNWELLFTNNHVHGVETTAELVGTKPSLDQRKSNKFYNSSVNTSFQCLFRRVGTLCQRLRTGGSWTLLEIKSHINVLELKVAKNHFYSHGSSSQSIHFQIDYIVALSYLVKMEGTHIEVVPYITKET